MKLIDATYAARALAILGCLFLLPSCKIINSLVKLPVKIVKTAARTVGVSNLTDQASSTQSGQRRGREGRSEARDEQGLDTAEQVSE